MIDLRKENENQPLFSTFNKTEEQFDLAAVKTVEIIQKMSSGEIKGSHELVHYANENFEPWELLLLSVKFMEISHSLNNNPFGQMFLNTM